MKFSKQLKINNFNSQKGFVALIISILILGIMMTIGVSITTLIIGRHQISANILKSNQAYFAAEAGIEDALLRLVENMDLTPTSTLKVGQATSTTGISEIIGGARSITAQGNFRDVIRRVRAVYEISIEEISFYYGAQVGEGGIIMDDGSTIDGNVFSNGNIEGTGNPEITGTAKVSKTGNYIDGITIGENALVDICKNSNISDTLTCANNISCTASFFESLTEEITTGTMAISQEQINKWKNDASSTIFIGDYVLKGQDQAFLGLQKIEGNLILQDKAKLYSTGTIWVTGNITATNTAEIRLDEDSFGSLSGVIISDGIITLKNSGKALGTGEPGSYLLLISTVSGEPAITIQNTFEADILYAQNGWIVVQDSADVREIGGYGIHLKNNAKIIYEIGLEDTSFSSGPGGSWQVTSWEEIE